jgi:Pyridoxamine 5'-phosphate oxidase
MAAQEPVAENLPANVEHPAPTPWGAAQLRIDGGRWYWLATSHPEGRPHVRLVLGVWLNGALYFVAGSASCKARNLVHNPQCTMTVAAEDAHLVVEGSARRYATSRRCSVSPMPMRASMSGTCESRAVCSTPTTAHRLQAHHRMTCIGSRRQGSLVSAPPRPGAPRVGGSSEQRIVHGPEDTDVAAVATVRRGCMSR